MVVRFGITLHAGISVSIQIFGFCLNIWGCLDLLVFQDFNTRFKRIGSLLLKRAIIIQFYIYTDPPTTPRTCFLDVDNSSIYRV